MKLFYIGESDGVGSYPLYKDENEKLWADINYNSTKFNDNIDKNYILSNFYSLTGNKTDGEPYISIQNFYGDDIEIELVFDTVKKPSLYKDTYMMLGRLKSDCDYYLGYGNRNEKHLWAGNVIEQISEMKKLYNDLPKNEKPEWLTWKQIIHYEKEMVI